MLVAPVKSEPGAGSTGVVLENVVLTNVKTGVADTSGKALHAGGTKRVKSWATGPVYSNIQKRELSSGTSRPSPRDQPHYGVRLGSSQHPSFTYAVD